jgi:hypothetical protein
MENSTEQGVLAVVEQHRITEGIWMAISGAHICQVRAIALMDELPPPILEAAESLWRACTLAEGITATGAVTFQ